MIVIVGKAQGVQVSEQHQKNADGQGALLELQIHNGQLRCYVHHSQIRQPWKRAVVLSILRPHLRRRSLHLRRRSLNNQLQPAVFTPQTSTVSFCLMDKELKKEGDEERGETKTSSRRQRPRSNLATVAQAAEIALVNRASFLHVRSEKMSSMQRSMNGATLKMGYIFGVTT